MSRQRATRWETVGAWLRIWTAPRDVEVAPVPWRTFGLVAAGLAALGIVLAFTALPALQDAKREGRAQEARREAAARRAAAARLRRAQRATTVPLREGDLRGQIRAAIERGARARVRSGELDAPRIRGSRCAAGEPVAGGRLSFSCLVVTRSTNATRRVTLGFPIIAIASRDRRSFAWCKQTPIAGEGFAFVQDQVPLAPACRERVG